MLSNDPLKTNTSTASVTNRPFGLLNDTQQVTLYTLTNNNGVSASITDFGATLVSFICPDKNGNSKDIVLGFDDVSDYKASNAYLGSMIGRFANRIAHAKFELNDQMYALPANSSPHHLHGGTSGFDSRIWHASALMGVSPRVRFSLFSPDGDQGYPGNLTCHVCYTLNDQNQLVIDIQASCDADTHCSITNHSYFNLAGNNDIHDHLLTIISDTYTPLSPGQVPLGTIEAVDDTPFDFREARKIGQRINDNHEQLQIGSGYDHNFMTPALQTEKVELAAILEEKTSGIKLRVSTDAPGIQMYTANFLDEKIGKGIQHGKRHAVCLEAQEVPDAPNQPDFPSSILKAGDRYKHTLIFEVSNDA